MRLEGWIEKDAKASVRLRRLGVGKTRPLWVVLAHSADMIVLFPVAALIWLFIGDPWKAWAWKAGLALLVGTFLTGILKLFFKRGRPDGEWGALDRLVDPHSFPSGHANRVAILATLAITYGSPVVGAAVSIWGLLVGTSRVILGMHYLLDVVVGFITGALVALFF